MNRFVFAGYNVFSFFLTLLLVGNVLAGESVGLPEEAAAKLSIPKEFNKNCEIFVEFAPTQILQNQGCYVVIKIKNNDIVVKTLTCSISCPLPLYVMLSQPNEKTFNWYPVWISKWEGQGAADGIVPFPITPKETKLLCAWFILKDFDGKNPRGPIFDKPGIYMLYIYGKKFEIEVVEGKSWMTDRELTDLFLGSERDVEARKAKLRKVLPDCKDPLDQIAGRLALGQKEEALHLARQSMPELAALLAVDENERPAPQEKEIKKIPEYSNAQEGFVRKIEYKPAQGDSTTVRKFMNQFVETLRTEDVERLLKLYDWELAELVAVKKADEIEIWRKGFERMRNSRSPIVISVASVEEPSVQDDLPSDLMAKNKTLRVVRMQFAEGSQPPRKGGRDLVVEEKGELKIVRWGRTANITPLSRRLMHSFGEQLQRTNEIPLKKLDSEGKAKETTLKNILLEAAGIPEERRKAIVVRQVGLKPVMESCQVLAYGFTLNMEGENQSGDENLYWVFIIHQEPKSVALKCVKAEFLKNIKWDDWDKDGLPPGIKLPVPEPAQ